MAKTFSIKQGDTAPLQMTLSGKDGAPQPLTGASVVLNLRWLGSPTLVVTRGACTVVSAAAGTIQYAWAAGETDAAGEVEGEVEVTFADGTIQTYPDDGYFSGEIVAQIA